MAAKLSRSQYSPALFDVAQDIAGGLPLRLVELWLACEQTQHDALHLLADSRVTGFNVVSDAAGLTRLTRQRGLMEILALINQPKEIVHGLGVASGGEAIGIWAADNTQMFYPRTVGAEALLSMLLAVQDAVRARCQIEIGLGAHFGEFYRLGGGLYGAESAAIEAIAEDHTEGGEIVVSAAIVARLDPGHGFTLQRREGPQTVIGPLYRLQDGPRPAAAPGPDVNYPIPYSPTFYADLLALGGHPGDRAMARAMERRYTVQRVVVLVERESQVADSHEIAVLNDVALSAMLKDAAIRHLEGGAGVEIKVSGPIGIYAFEDPVAALEFAESFRRVLDHDEIVSRFGIDVGPVLIFDLAGGGKDIAGMPVNVASKMAQDRGCWGRIYLSAAVHALVEAPGYTELRYSVSGVDLVVYEG
jgi:hypothetical protein